VITIEGSEEGEIYDLLYYLNTYKHLLGSPSLVICLDAGAATPESMMITNSLRGCANFDIKVKVASNNVHSGSAGGVVPNPYTIITAIINQICDPVT
jgi:acetylornithine deacetylase/succinyl-diaminopimelate desuccinylase-like protein